MNLIGAALALASLLIATQTQSTVASSEATPPPSSPTPSSPTPSSDLNYKASIKAVRGHRPYMEDEFIVSPGSRFCGVFDGHGGSKVSQYLRDNLYSKFSSKLSRQQSLPEVVDAIKDSFKEVDDEVQAVKKWSYQGSTAVVCYMHSDEKTGETTIVSANVGDSRAVLSRQGKAKDLTVDHKPNDKREKSRIKKLGGKVSWFGYRDNKGKPIPGSGVYRINGNLAVARAIGDRTETPFVSSEVEILDYKVEEGDEFIILASDGVWDVMTSEETVDFVHQMLRGSVGALPSGDGTRKAVLKMSDWAMKEGDDSDIIQKAVSMRKKKMAKFLVEESMRRGSSDNICAIVLWLDKERRTRPD
ncbi:hypothetical protein TrVE_jg11397 [Triparma verrucosa]|uniref:PPM-type phosphatase domain-containing protein n=1 Tax=Triparma verrucosa TaxID=1606542 RepID=A0A9W7B442_9STRA|nr:hypothetical protein TrVE_jg11397 [Triparma verrucosa]